MQKMWNLSIWIKRNDQVGGKRLSSLIIDFLVKHHVAGATVWTGVDGFGKRGKSTLHMEGIAVNMPLIIDIIDMREKLEPLLPDLKSFVDDNGLISITEVNVV